MVQTMHFIQKVSLFFYTFQEKRQDAFWNSMLGIYHEVYAYLNKPTPYNH